MKRTLALALLLAGCQAVPQPVPPTPQVMPEVQAFPAVVPKPVASVIQQYNTATQKEVQAITSPTATPDSVRSVQAAHNNAQKAVHRLKLQGNHPTQDTVSAAKAAVRDLTNVVNAPP